MLGSRTLASLVFVLFVLHIDKAAATPEKPDGQATIAGKILNGSSEAVAGAEVTLYQLGKMDRFQVASPAVTTNGSGVYEFRGLKDGTFMISVTRDGFARTFHLQTLKTAASEHVDVALGPPASVVIRVEDEHGQPVAGARVREMTRRGANGEVPLLQIWMRSLGIAIPPSDAEGRLRLPPLPAGEIIKVTLAHAELAPACTEALTVSVQADPVVRMKPGVILKLHAPAGQIASATLKLYHSTDDSSTIRFYEADFDAEGVARLAVAPGEYSHLALQHENFYLTPTYAVVYQTEKRLRIEPGRNQDLYFEVRRQVPVRGRVVEADTGKPLKGMAIMGQIAQGVSQGWADLPPSQWSDGGWGVSDEQGRYTIDLAPGPARLLFEGSELVAERGEYEVNVAEDGSTGIPDFRVRPLRKIVGVVRNPDGTRAARAVVRLRGKFVRLQPVLTDDAGRFEIQPRVIPLDPTTGKPDPAQHVVAFDPYRPLAAAAGVQIDQAEEVAIQLEPHAPDWPLSAFPAELSDWELGKSVVPARDAARSLRGQTPPEIDACLWINTAGRSLPFADLRGKYVLLDFWFTGCGPCHADFPSVKLVHELYKDRVQVIGVHDNTSAAEAVREHVAQIGLPFAVAVDHPDGRTVARFEEHGLPGSYPAYVLISPEGKVLLDDRTIPHPKLRVHKLEIIRRLLLESQPTGK